VNIDHLRQAIDEPDLSGTHYELVEFLGSGGMGSVYVVHDKNLARHVALKVLRLPDPSGQFTERMIREAKIVAQLEHPGIVPIHDIGILPDGRPFYVSKYINGYTLDHFARTIESTTEKLNVFKKICEAVAFAHSRGVIHRDLKPQNIIIGLFGEVLVIDWGVAKVATVLDEVTEEKSPIPNPKSESTAPAQSPLRTQPPEQSLPALPESFTPPFTGGQGGESNTAGSALRIHPSSLETASGSIIGTPGYMSPEQQQGLNMIVDERSDIYALGATLRELLNMGTQQNELPKSLLAIVQKAMSNSPALRYATVTEFAADISSILENQPVSAYPENIAEKASRWVTKNWFVVVLIATYIIMRILIYFIARD
jgi:serine/threonine protein kinase